MIGNSVFIPIRSGNTDGWGEFSEEDIQQNFKGMRMYRVADPEGIEAMEHLQRSLNEMNEANGNAGIIAQDFQILLESAVDLNDK
jgi:hypothetical protein